jgi:hypothetical protein
VRHQRETAEFDRIMAEKQAKNGNEGERSVRRASWVAPVQKTAPSPRAESCAPPAQNFDTGPVQETARQESYLSRTTPLENQTTPLVPADAETDAIGDELTLVSPTYVAPTQQPTFEDFYAAYPRHVQPKAARKAWDKAVKEASPRMIVDGALRYNADPNRPGGVNRPNDQQWIPHPATWLNKGSWADEPAPAVAQGRGRAYDDAATWGSEEERIAQAEQRRQEWEAMSDAEREAELDRAFGSNTAASGE